MAGGKKKTKVRYECYENGVRVPCPENFKESPEFKQYLRQKKARLHDTSRHYMEDSEDTGERTYYDDSVRTYYDETIKEEANDWDRTILLRGTLITDIYPQFVPPFFKFM